MEITTRRRRALSTVLALLLAIESVSAVAAAATVTRTDGGAPARTGSIATGLTAPAENGPASAPLAGRLASIAGTARRPGADATAVVPSNAVEAAPPPAFAPRVAVAAVAAGKPKASKAPKAPSGSAHTSSTARASSSTKTSSRSYHGTNHFWFPALGISRPIYSYACSRKTALSNLVYRWGCAGSNNVYLMGHAWGVFKPLHDAYVRGRLRVGMKTYYADGSGRTHTYVIRWWKLTRPTTAASWAWASQSRPSMTLQTCIGANSEYRLMVRLVEVH